MEITKKQVDELNAVLQVKISKDDYSPKVDTKLKEVGQTANIKGFRPGKVPRAILQKMFGTSVLVEEVNKLLMKSVFEYIENEKLDILGEPIPSMEETQINDFTKETDFEFSFDLGMKPQIPISIQDLKLSYYQVIVDDTLINKQVEYYSRKFAKSNAVDVASENSFLVGKLTEQAADGSIMEGGLNFPEFRISVPNVDNKDAQAELVGLAKETSVSVDIKQIFGEGEQLANVLGIPVDQANAITSKFLFEVTTITDYEPHPNNDDLWIKAFGEEVTTEKGFRDTIKKEISGHYVLESNYRLLFDAKKQLEEQANIKLPASFLKRWIVFSNTEKNLSALEMEERWPEFEKDMTWQLIQNEIARICDMKVTKDDIHAQAIKTTRKELERYGISPAMLSDDMLEKWADEKLKTEESQRNLAFECMQEKIIFQIKELAPLTKIEISLDDFMKLPVPV